MEGNSIRKNQNVPTAKLLIILLIMVTIITIGLAIALGMLLIEYTKADVCFTSECVHASSKILQLMDSSVDPCEDFYEFACGGFIKNNEYDASTTTEANNLIMEQLRTAIEEPLRPDESKPNTLIKKLYKSCMNETLIEQIGLTDFKEILMNVGGWPVLDGRNRNYKDFDWKEHTYKLQNIGFSGNFLIKFSVAVDDKDSSRRVIYLDKPSMEGPMEVMEQGLNHKSVKAYYDYMVDVARMFGADEGTARRELLDALQFQILLAKIIISSESKKDVSYNLMTIKELQSKYHTIPWLEFINTLLHPYETVTDDDIVIVVSPEYLTNLENLIRQTTKRAQANYIMGQAVMSGIGYLSRKLWNKEQTAITIPRWNVCVRFTSVRLNVAVSALYVRKYLNKDVKENVQALVSNIRAQLKNSLNEVDWMDEKTKENALDKLEAMKAYVGYPDELLDDLKLEEHYQGLEVDERKFFQSSFNITIFNAISSFKQLRLPVKESDLPEIPSDITSKAFYIPRQNSILLPIGVLQGMFFSHDRPNYMNYGRIGSVVGRELTHGFDNNGRLYDKNGDIFDWWMPETNKSFAKRAKCIVDYYDHYTVPEIGLNLNSIRAQGESIADIGGFKYAYLAYDRWARTNGEEPRLPGLNYTGRQLFWISAASHWCNRYHPNMLTYRINSKHLPEKYRILGAFSNQNQFGKDFQCKPGSEMNPINKCQLW